MNYPLVIVKFRDVIQDSSWDGPDKVNCPVVKSVGWLVESGDPIKIAGTLTEEGDPCAILAIPRGCVLDLPDSSLCSIKRQSRNQRPFDHTARP